MNLKILVLIGLVVVLIGLAVMIENGARPPTGRRGEHRAGESR